MFFGIGQPAVTRELRPVGSLLIVNLPYEFYTDSAHTHFGSIVHFDKPKRYYRNAFLLPSVGLNPSPLTTSNGEGFKR